MKVDELLDGASATPGYNYAFLDEPSKRELRRKTLKAVSIPGHQVPFGSREMPLARGWGTGGCSSRSPSSVPATPTRP